MRFRCRPLIMAALMILLTLAACAGPQRVLVGAGTTLVDSGFMDELENRFGGDISVVAGSTAEILELAAQGAIALAIVHDEAQEVTFVAGHPAAERRPVFASRFIFVGPPGLVAAAPATNPTELLTYVASRRSPFVTRGDGSGTHSRELDLWEASGIVPDGDWYIATGQGMGFTLQVADQRGSFTLSEEGAYLAAAGTIDLVPVELASPQGLTNPYHAVLVDPAGEDFFEWLTGPGGQEALPDVNEAVFGRQVYVVSSDADE